MGMEQQTAANEMLVFQQNLSRDNFEALQTRFEKNVNADGSVGLNIEQVSKVLSSLQRW